MVREGCIYHDLYRRVLLPLEAVMIYIWKSKSKSIGSQLHHILLDQYEDTQIQQDRFDFTEKGKRHMLYNQYLIVKMST